MNILAIETSSPLLSVACKRSDGTLMESNLEGGLYHAENLMVLVEQVLKTLKLKRSDLDVLACGVGPGSFTGLRIGLAAAKGLSTGLRKKIIPVSSLDAVSEGVWVREGHLGVLLDARRGMLYAAQYEFKHGTSKKIFRDSLISLDALVSKMGADTIYCGEGLRVYGDELKKRMGSRFQMTSEQFWKPKAASVLSWIERYPKKAKSITAAQLTPSYLRLSEAEERKRMKP